MSKTASGRLLSIMDDLGLEQQHLACLVGVSESAMSLYVAGKRNPRQSVMILVAIIEAGHDLRELAKA